MILFPPFDFWIPSPFYFWIPPSTSCSCCWMNCVYLTFRICSRFSHQAVELCYQYLLVKFSTTITRKKNTEIEHDSDKEQPRRTIIADLEHGQRTADCRRGGCLGGADGGSASAKLPKKGWHFRSPEPRPQRRATGRSGYFPMLRCFQ